ncbi:MAG TPA: hypothetical protein VE032_07890 [Actinomycetota bacterium]|nr:hypothetical protein [Actinomycetota bacterium]
MTDPVRIKAAYERSPTGLKGAFVLRGGDGQPHQVRLEGASVVGWAGEGSERIILEPSIIEAAPTLDTFVPFEVSTLDLLAGWYRIRCDVVIDAVEAVIEPGPRFVVSWPRGAVRRGSTPIDTTTGGVELRALECAGDSVRIGYAAEEAPADVALTVDGRTHPLLEVEHDDAGKGRILGYPALRDQARLAVRIGRETPVEVALP